VTAQASQLDLVLATIDAWPVERAAAAVVVREGPFAEHGDTEIQFEWASVTKLVIALAVLVAVERDLVGLDDAAGPPGSTVRHLLAHTSGLAFDGDALLAPPGRRRIYSNAGFDMLGAVVAERTGLPVEQVVGQWILGRWG
jgi:CubicO group peptidase (beta-lactamase class C family)